MQDISIGQGETIRQKIVVEETGASTARFVAIGAIPGEDIPFVGLEADVSVTDTIVPPGSYDYYYEITWDDGSVDYLPDFRNCDGDCEFPQLIVCEIPGVS